MLLALAPPLSLRRTAPASDEVLAQLARARRRSRRRVPGRSTAAARRSLGARWTRTAEPAAALVGAAAEQPALRRPPAGRLQRGERRFERVRERLRRRHGQLRRRHVRALP